MRKVLFSLIIALLSVTFSAQAQTNVSQQKVSVSKKSASIQEVLNFLAFNYQINFSYSKDLVALQQEVTVQAVDLPLNEVLDKTFREKGIQYSVIGNQIALRKVSHSQFTISGTIKDSLSGETLIGATVRLEELPASISTSNTYGFYSISAPSAQYKLVVSYTGYASQSITVGLVKDLVLNINLRSNSTLQEVVVTARSTSGNVSNPHLGVEKLNMQTIKDVPILFGEKDILKTLQLLPGIKSAGEGNSGFYVRGGASDQNLIVLDEAIVYNASHLLGFLSTFNSDAIKDVTVYKGGMPAQYGGRLASALDIRMNEGDQNKNTVEGGIGLISSRLKLEGPIKKGKGSFMLSGRRSYADAIFGLFPSEDFTDAALYFFDFNAKANYKVNEKNTFYISSYSGKDHLGFGDNFKLNWGNTTGTMRWNHLFNQRLFSNTTIVYSDYNYTIQNLDLSVKQVQDNNNLQVKSIIRDINFKQDYQYFANNRHTLRFGVNAIHHKIHPGRVRLAETSSADE
ncbi:MAG TPA: carboxypeptidase-like regulatory domain-containing protein, partial [Pedobacter sp.]